MRINVRTLFMRYGWVAHRTGRIRLRSLASSACMRMDLGIALQGRLRRRRRPSKNPTFVSFGRRKSSKIRLAPATTRLPLRHRPRRRPLSQYPYRGAGYSVAIIDTGIDYNNPNLGGGFGPGYRVIAGYDFVNNDADPMDDNGHGTLLASVIGSSSTTAPGIDPAVNFIDLKVLDSQMNGSWTNIDSALQWVISHKAQYNIVAVNLSLGSGNYTTNPYSLLENDFTSLKSMGVFTARRRRGTTSTPTTARRASPIPRPAPTSSPSARPGRGTSAAPPGPPAPRITPPPPIRSSAAASAGPASISSHPAPGSPATGSTTRRSRWEARRWPPPSSPAQRS